VRGGEAIAFVGPSGAGKTTLLRALGAALEVHSGEISVDGVPLQTLSGHRLRRVRGATGFVHQDLRLVPNLRVLQNVLCGRLGAASLPGSLRMMVLPSRDQRRSVYQLLDRVGIAEKMYERTDRLSGGEQQRLAIARALFQKPRVLLADEPVSSVDPARARDTVALLSALSREAGLTLCVSLHNVELAREFFPRLIGLCAGSVVFDRPTADVSDDSIAALYRLHQRDDHAPS
jgi:phosphonate transport system ATP-binding protein